MPKSGKTERRHQIWKKAGGVCAHCGNKVYGTKTVDHFIPKSMGGGNDPRNLMPLCRRCNGQRSSKWVDPWSFYPYASKEAIWGCEAYARRFFGLRKPMSREKR